MIEETFFNYRNYRWMWIHLLLLSALTTVYVYDNPIGGRSGRTFLGYTYGTIATAGILYLLWFGMRKRSHYSRLTTLKGCLAVHVWLGLSLAILVPLHAGFNFGWNVHTLAYALMVGVIASGLLGAVIYIRMPTRILSNRGGGTVKHLVEQIETASSDIDWLAKDRSDEFQRLLDRVDFKYRPSMMDALRARSPEPLEARDLAKFLSRLPDKEGEEGLKLVGLATKKRQLIKQVHEEIRVAALFRTWLYLHVPLSYGLVAALAIHIFSVFYYR